MKNRKEEKLQTRIGGNDYEITASDLRKIRSIKILLEKAGRIYNQITLHGQDTLCNFHTADGTLIYCLDYGVQVAGELLKKKYEVLPVDGDIPTGETFSLKI